MAEEKINELLRINLVLQKSPNITIKADKKHFRQRLEAMQHKGFYLKCHMKIKMFIFKSNKKRIKADKKHFRQRLEAMQHKEFYLKCHMKIKMFIFKSNKKRPRVQQVEPWSWKYSSRQRYLVCVSSLLFLNLTLRCTVFAN